MLMTLPMFLIIALILVGIVVSLAVIIVAVVMVAKRNKKTEQIEQSQE